MLKKIFFILVNAEILISTLVLRGTYESYGFERSNLSVIFIFEIYVLSFLSIGLAAASFFLKKDHSESLTLASILNFVSLIALGTTLLPFLL
jgi:hypothetical protein